MAGQGLKLLLPMQGQYKGTDYQRVHVVPIDINVMGFSVKNSKDLNRLSGTFCFKIYNLKYGFK